MAVSHKDPSWIAKILKGAWAIVAARSAMFNGLIFNGLVALEVVGRKSGQIIPILKAYLHAAPGAHPHVRVDKDAPLAEFEKIAADNPVFRVTSIQEMLHGI